MADNEKKFEEMFGTNAQQPVPPDRTGHDRPEKYPKKDHKDKKRQASRPVADDLDYLPIRKSREMKVGCLGGMMYFVFVVSVSVIFACLAWMAASDVLALNKPHITAVIDLDESVFTQREVETTDGNGNPTTKTVNIADIDYVADRLKAEGLISYKSLFKFFCKISDAEEKLDPGSYELSTDFDYRALVKKMNQGSGAAVTVEITFPEGFTMDQIFRRLEENNVSTYENLMKAAANFSYNYTFLEGAESGAAERLEGYLFPDTYQFFAFMEPSSAIGKLLDNYSTRVTEEMEQQAADRGMSMREVLIVASMIEKEAANAEEAPTVASVIYNRLAGNMPLQIDATTDYAMQLAGRGNEKTDYNIDSPYNTYVVTGLPAGPICNPGLSSIKAALAPADTQYYYYALDVEAGTHRFFNDYNSHQAFVATQNYG
ncbi:MAG: endolytic transglycosylase MltG [Oscillospiraceae bacterium]|jgi:UPF0755 protein|nr:endolytic transglycosylase MltG [Oscillospiraceae bacterium]